MRDICAGDGLRQRQGMRLTSRTTGALPLADINLYAIPFLDGSEE